MENNSVLREYRETTINANGQQFVRVQEFNWDEDGVKVNAKNGFIECKPGRGGAIAEKLRKGERQAVFGQFNRQQGLYNVTYINPETGDTTEHSPTEAAREAAQTLETK